MKGWSEISFHKHFKHLNAAHEPFLNLFENKHPLFKHLKVQIFRFLHIKGTRSNNLQNFNK